jgi:hypothetical protein
VEITGLQTIIFFSLPVLLETCLKFATVAASMAGGIVVISFVMFLFRSSVVWGFVFKDPTVQLTPHKKKSGRIMCEDHGGQSHFEINLSPKEF